MKKRIIIIAVVVFLVAGAVAGGAFGYRTYQKNKLVADVQLVQNLNFGYAGDSMESSGLVTNDASQNIKLDTQQTVLEVFVEEGQTVNVGDPLLQYDMTTIDLQIEMKKLDIQTIDNHTALAERELDTLKKTTPITKTEPTPQPPETPPAVQDPVIAEKTGEAYNYVSATAVAYNGDGSTEKPFRFLCTKDAYVYGSYLNYLMSNGYTAVFEVRKGDTAAGAIQTSWTVNGASLQEKEPESKWYIANGEEAADDDGIPEDTPEELPQEVPQEGYTADELVKEITKKEQELKKLDIDKRTAQLELKKLENQSADGMVYAEINGVVKNVGDPLNPPNDGTPFLAVSGSEGLYVKGSISELSLDKVQTGQSITGTSWNTGMSFDAKITSINDYPEEQANYNGSGNANASYYGYTAYVEDSSGLTNGEYVGLMINTNADAENAMNAIYLDKAYVRQEDGKSYVFKEGENGRLVKQYVETGKTLYGQSVEIKSGLSLEDKIAFPYGKTAKEGVKTASSDSDNMMK